MKRLQPVVLGIAVLMFGTAVVSVKGGGGSSNVTSHLQQPAAAAAPVFFSDAGRSGTDSYVTTAGKTPVSSVLQSGGDWQLDTQSAARAVWLDLGDPSVPWATPAATGQYLHTLLTTHCASIGATPVASLAGIGSSTNCGMSFRIDYGTDVSVYYLIHFNATAHPGTGDIKFTCNAVASTNSCIDWTAVPADDDIRPGDGRRSGAAGKSDIDAERRHRDHHRLLRRKFRAPHHEAITETLGPDALSTVRSAMQNATLSRERGDLMTSCAAA